MPRDEQLSPAQVRERGEKLAPGCYGVDGVLHVLTEDVAAEIGLDPSNPAHIAMILRGAQQIAEEAGIPHATQDDDRAA